MSDALSLMGYPLAACLILSGMHAYLGLHVIQREVIFVDLALAQVAALGATVGLLWGVDLHSPYSYWIALTFTLIGAAIFAMTRLRRPVVPQEALIGVVYVVAAAAVIIVLSRAPEGAEELKALLVGHLLFVDRAEVAKLFWLYAGIGLVHWWFRRPLLLISQDPESAFERGMRVRWWDFLFYATFGFVVTSSVEVAGVLLVFAFLVVPAICGALLAKSIDNRLWIGWAVALAASLSGISASYIIDIPTGAAIVCTFGVWLLICALVRCLPKSTQ